MQDFFLLEKGAFEAAKMCETAFFHFSLKCIKTRVVRI